MEIDDALVVALERSESAAWCDSVDALSTVPGNPAGAEVVQIGAVSIPVVAVDDDGFFNCVQELGAIAPATGQDVDRVSEVYDARSVAAWSITVAPTATSSGLAELLLGRGLVHGSDFAKVVRSTANPPAVSSDLRVERIGPEHAGVFASMNLAAWGLTDALEGWFSRCVGRPGWSHYLCLDEATPVATAALFARDGLGWLSWATTVPAQRGRGAQAALITARIRDAAAQGCSLVHSEVYDESVDAQSPSLRNLLRTGFRLAYRRPCFDASPGAGQRSGRARA